MIDIRAVLKGHKLGIRFNPPVFTDTQEDDPVNCLSYSEIEFTLRQLWISEGDNLRQGLPPSVDVRKEGGINTGSSFFATRGCGVAVEGAFENGILGKDRMRLLPRFFRSAGN